MHLRTIINKIPSFMKRLFICSILLAVSILKAHSQVDTASTNKTLSEFINYYNQNQSDSIYNIFSTETKKALPLNSTESFVSQLKAQFGNIISSNYLANQENIITYIGYFENKGYELFININESNRIVGLFLKPVQLNIVSADSTLSPNNISLKISDASLFGTLIIPETSNKVPVILIIAGLEVS